MHVLLLILKILGIALGSIVGAVLFPILLVLIVPIRYAGEADKHEKINFKARGSWLLHILHVTFGYSEQGTELKMKVFGITVYPKKEKPEKAIKKKRKKTKKSKKAKQAKQNKEAKQTREENQDKRTEHEDVQEPEVTPDVQEINDVKEQDIREEAQVTEETCSNEETQHAEYTDIPEEEQFTEEDDIGEDGEDLAEKIINAIEHVLDLIDEIPDKISDKAENIYVSVAEKLNSIYNKWVKIKSLIDDERVRRTVNRVFKKVGKLLKHVLPRRIRGTFDYGFDDPAVTGYITAACGALYGSLGKVFTFRPDFENKKLEADVSFRGKIRLGYIAVLALFVYLNKDFRYTLKLVKNFGDDLQGGAEDDFKDMSDASSDFYDDLDL